MFEEIQITELLILREGNGKIAIFDDENSDFYKPVFLFSQSAEQKEIEQIKSRFLIELIEKYGYQTQDISLDAGFGLGVYDFTGLIIWQRNTPFLIADFLTSTANQEQTKKAKRRLLDKAKTFNVGLAVLVKGDKIRVFAIEGEKISLSVIPHKTKIV